MSDRKIKLGFVSAAHLHTAGLVRAAFDTTEAEVVGLAEGDDELRQHFAREFPGLKVFKTNAELYEQGQPEAIVTCADNVESSDVVAQAATRGIHVMKEKPMAANLALAETMATTAARCRVRLMVNWPIAWQPALIHAKQLVEGGAIGTVWQVHYRTGHGGPPSDYASRGPIARVGWGWLIDRERNGAGALVDFCSYGAVLSRWFMGQPCRVVALGGRYSKDFFTVEDNAILVLGYPHGHSVCEGTWTQVATAVPTPLTIYGTEGTLAVTSGSDVILARRDASDRWPEKGPTTLTAPALSDHFRSGPAYFVHQLLTGDPFDGIVSADLSRDATEILEAGLQAIAEGGEVGLPLKSFLG